MKMIEKEHGVTYRGRPREMLALVRKRKGTFFVQGDTKCWTDDKHYLPLAGNVQVTRSAFIRYLKDIVETAERQEEHRNVTIEIEVDNLGSCWFI